MSTQIKELKEKRGNLLKQQEDLVLKAATEKRALTTEENTTFDTIEVDIRNINSTIERIERLEAAKSAQAEPIEDPVQLNAKQKFNTAMRKYIMYGEHNLNEEEKKTLNMRATQMSKTTAEGGATVMTDFMPDLIKALKAYGGVMDVAYIKTTGNGSDILWPLVNDTAQTATQIDELGSVSTAATAPTFSQKTIKAFKWGTGFLPISTELIEDSEFDIMALMAEFFTERIWRAMNTNLTTGAGTTTASGIVTAATASGVTAAAAAITRDNILNLIHSVDPAYRKKATLMFNDNTLLAIKKLVDGESRPLYMYNPIEGDIPMIEGYKYTINTAMADIGVSAKSILFGDFSKYLVRIVNQIRMVQTAELYRTTDAIGIGAFWRFDGQLLDAGTHPVKYLVHAAS